ncbi:MAG: thioesterase family protein [Microthrixaceae bacterium]|nr:thioesterase family protein [Microthrixaceae bacterium]MCB1010686.1 thioesterase family protein [Microthrixaceae bacterium]MCB9386293.1 thioesterase family protein [Microthrixaceae bacterium]MCO5320984.1 thioesterase family protein [Microthrixaceae bacterium]
MDASDWLGLEPTHNPHRWCLPVTEGIATRGRFLFGGCGLGAAVAALEQTTGRPLVWATAQYLSFAMIGDVVDLDVTISVEGHATTQARLVAHVGEREILTVNGALGSKDHPAAGQYVDPPEVPAAADCPARPAREEDERSIMTRLDMRLAKGRQWDDLDGHPVTDGRSALWVRLPDEDGSPLAVSGGSLAILGDYVPFGISQSQGIWWPSNSLDNTIRIVSLADTEWILVDVRVEGIAGGFGHGTVYLWSDSGVLLATASQSALLRSQAL